MNPERFIQIGYRSNSGEGQQSRADDLPPLTVGPIRLTAGCTDGSASRRRWNECVQRTAGKGGTNAQRTGSMLQVMRRICYADSRRTVIVLGAPRGGTSMLAGTLERLGVHMGENLGRQKEDACFRRETPLEAKLAAIAANSAARAIWGWKLPNTVYYYWDVHHHLTNPIFVSIYRNPLEVAMSSARHDGRVLSLQLLRVPIEHYDKVHGVIDGFPDVPWATCSFETVTEGAAKGAFVDALIAFLGLQRSAERRASAIEFINREKGYQD